MKHNHSTLIRTAYSILVVVNLIVLFFLLFFFVVDETMKLLTYGRYDEYNGKIDSIHTTIETVQ